MSLRSDPGCTGDSCFPGAALGGQVGYLKASRVTLNAWVYAAEMSLQLIRIILLIRLNPSAHIWLSCLLSDCLWWLRYLWNWQIGPKVDRTLSEPVAGGQAAWPGASQVAPDPMWRKMGQVLLSVFFLRQNLGKMWMIFELTPQY